MGKEDEHILVVPRHRLFGDTDQHAFSGYLPREQAPFCIEEVVTRYGEFRRCGQKGEAGYLEEDASMKQIIPQAIFLSGRGDASQIFVYQSLKGSGESRLHGRNMIGIGGHVNTEDGPLDNSILSRGRDREISEEVHIVDPYRMDMLGYVNLDDNLLGAVHFGVFYALRGTSPSISVKETDKLSGRMVPLDQLASLDPPLQGWHSIIRDVIVDYAKRWC